MGDLVQFRSKPAAPHMRAASGVAVDSPEFVGMCTGNFYDAMGLFADRDLSTLIRSNDNYNDHDLFSDESLQNDITGAMRDYIHAKQQGNARMILSCVNDITGLTNQLSAQAKRGDQDVTPSHVHTMLDSALSEASQYYFRTNIFAAPVRER